MNGGDHEILFRVFGSSRGVGLNSDTEPRSQSTGPRNSRRSWSSHAPATVCRFAKPVWIRTIRAPV